MSSALTIPVKWFVDDVTSALTEISRDAEDLRTTVANDAFTLAAGFVDADERLTDDELWALTAAFGPLLETQLAGATPDTLRSTGLITGKRATIDRPSELFQLLVDADHRDGTVRSHVYYKAAVDLAFAVAAIDAHTSIDELDSIERFRGTLLRAMDAAGVRRPGQPAPTPTPAAPTPSTPRPQTTTEATTAPPPEKDPPPRPIDELYAELDGLVGLDEVKKEVRRTADLARIEKVRLDRGLPILQRSRHLVFTGNPGTGKTTVARLLAQIYRTLGVVSRGHLVERDRSQLVAGFIGQTAPLVRKAFDDADGGMLLIDEAYALARGGPTDFGLEAIDTVVKLAEDRRDTIIVVLAGYPEEMAVLVDANPGMRSRFPKTIFFPDYSNDELMQIFDSLGKKPKYTCDDAARAKVRAYFEAQPRTRGFGNGRLARNLFEAAIAQQATRLAGLRSEPTDEQLCTLIAADIPDAIPSQ
jgi:hypothetical protein